ncbi:MAG: hypothetical protein LBP24_02500 [Coriobacteriales bacterium]|nr:hypothetical protein [Coriobacteriales bacterium]
MSRWTFFAPVGIFSDCLPDSRELYDDHDSNHCHKKRDYEISGVEYPFKAQKQSQEQKRPVDLRNTDANVARRPPMHALNEEHYRKRKIERS